MNMISLYILTATAGYRCDEPATAEPAGIVAMII